MPAATDIKPAPTTPEHPGRVPQPRAARPRAGPLPPARRRRVRRAHQELRPVRGHRRARRHRPADLQARHRDHHGGSIGRQLLQPPGPVTRPPFSRAIVIVLDSLGVGELPDAADYGDQGSNTLGHIARRVPPADPDAPRPGPVADRRTARRRAGRVARGGLRPDGGAVAGQGLGHRALGADGARDRPRRSRCSRTASPRRPSASSSGGSAARRWGTPSRRAPSSSRSSAPSTCAPARRSSTRRPTASSRSPRTRTSSRCPSCTGSARSPTTCSCTGMGLGRIIARPFVGSPGVVPAHVEPPRFRRAAGRRDRCSTGSRPRASRSSRSARSWTCSPGRASPSRCTPRPTTRGWTRWSGRWRSGPAA